MHLSQSIKLLVKRHFLMLSKVLIASCPLLALMLLVFLGFLLSKFSLDHKFECVSSFIEVMIAVNASCSFRKIGEGLKRRREQHQTGNLIAVSVLHGSLEEVSLSPAQADRLMLVDVCSSLDVYLKYVGLAFAFLLTGWLMVGVTAEARPFAVLAALPLLAYLLAVLVANKLVELSYAAVVESKRPSSPSAPIDDGDVVSSALGCTGPSFNEESSHE